MTLAPVAKKRRTRLATASGGSATSSLKGRPT
jgi:hypothetical protein